MAILGRLSIIIDADTRGLSKSQGDVARFTKGVSSSLKSVNDEAGRSSKSLSAFGAAVDKYTGAISREDAVVSAFADRLARNTGLRLRNTGAILASTNALNTNSVSVSRSIAIANNNSTAVKRIGLETNKSSRALVTANRALSTHTRFVGKDTGAVVRLSGRLAKNTSSFSKNTGAVLANTRALSSNRAGAFRLGTSNNTLAGSVVNATNAIGGMSLGLLAKVAVVGLVATRITLLIDRYNILQQRIRTATEATNDYILVSESLNSISSTTGTTLLANVNLFQAIARASDTLNATTPQIIQFTNAIAQIGVIGGSTPTQLANGTLQLSQALSEGILRAQELNSLFENIPEVTARIAKGLGVSQGELRKMVLEGKILSTDVFRVILAQAGEIDAQFKGISLSIARASSALAQNTTILLGNIDSHVGFTSFIANAIGGVSDGVARVAKAIGSNANPKAKEFAELWKQAAIDSGKVKDNALGIVGIDSDENKKTSPISPLNRQIQRNGNLRGIASVESNVQKAREQKFYRQIYSIVSGHFDEFIKPFKIGEKQYDEKRLKIAIPKFTEKMYELIYAQTGKRFFEITQYVNDALVGAKIGDFDNIVGKREDRVIRDVNVYKGMEERGSFHYKEPRIRNAEDVRYRTDYSFSVQIAKDILATEKSTLKIIKRIFPKTLIRLLLAFAKQKEVGILSGENEEIELQKKLASALKESLIKNSDEHLPLILDDSTYRHIFTQTSPVFQASREHRSRQGIVDLSNDRNQRKSIEEAYRTAREEGRRQSLSVAASEKSQNIADSRAMFVDSFGAFGSEESQERERYNTQMEQLIENRDRILEVGLDYDAKELELKEEHSRRLQEIKEKEYTKLTGLALLFNQLGLDQSKKAGEDRNTTEDNLFVQRLSTIGQNSRKAFSLYKALAISEALITAPRAILSAYAAGTKIHPLVGVAYAAAATLATGLQIARIRQQTYQGGRELGGSVSANSVYRVNEQGTELFTQGDRSYLLTGGQGGHVTANKDLQSKTVVNVTVNGTPNNYDASVEHSTTNDQENILINLIDRTKGSIIGDLQTGGSGISNTFEGVYNLARQT